MTENIEIISAYKIVLMKLFRSCSAVITGITIRAAISKTPIIGIDRETVIAASKIKIVLINLVGIPLTFAASSSKVTNTNSL